MNPLIAYWLGFFTVPVVLLLGCFIDDKWEAWKWGAKRVLSRKLRIEHKINKLQKKLRETT